MLHLLYIFAFTIIAFVAISNLIRSLITISTNPQRNNYPIPNNNSIYSQTTIHPELLDSNGEPIKESLLVMRSVSVEDARAQLDALYNASPSATKEDEEA